MKIKLSCLIFASIFGLTACGTVWKSATPQIELNYKTENAIPNGVVQVFDIGGNTVVHMRDYDNLRPRFIARSGSVISHKIYGQNIVLDGMYSSFDIVTTNGMAKISRIGQEPVKADALNIAKLNPPTPDVSPQTLAKYKDESPESLQAEITSLRTELNTLRTMIVNLNSNGESGSTPDAASETASSSIVVRFKDNSVDFEPEGSLKSSLLDLSRDASRINVKGYTDSFKATPAATRLAKLRAESAKSFLVNSGIAKEKISVDFQSAGGFVASNNTKEGKAANRRVDINLVTTR